MAVQIRGEILCRFVVLFQFVFRKISGEILFNYFIFCQQHDTLSPGLSWRHSSVHPKLVFEANK